jgi:hypothetical protein
MENSGIVAGSPAKDAPEPQQRLPQGARSFWILGGWKDVWICEAEEPGTGLGDPRWHHAIILMMMSPKLPLLLDISIKMMGIIGTSLGTPLSICAETSVSGKLTCSRT